MSEPIERDRMRKLLLVGCAALALGGSAAAVASQTPRNETFRMLELFGDVVGIVERLYVVPVDNKKLIEAALAGMMTALDPHSNYLPAKAFGDLRERTSGEYSGVGLTITSEGGLVKVISPMDESPASRAGRNAAQTLIYGAPVSTEASVARIEAVTAEDLKRVGARVLESGLSASAVLGPKGANGAGAAFAKRLAA